MTGAWIYILECSDGSFYTGLTKQEPEGRLWEHNNRIYKDAYTSTRLPVRLAYAEFHDSIVNAIEAERRIKGWSRAKKIAMMNGDWKRLVELAKRRGGKT
ncbi:MAG: GIY-YIG nuclease family protein [Alphaproteobacteria bacterium]|nr:GIY-YIG nuclease family protein [Alphaproteobacteria bacterium]